MRYSLAASALILAATTVLAQDPVGQTCVANSQGTFEVMIEEINGPAVARRGLKTDSSVKHLGRIAKRQEAACMSQGTLVATLRDGVLTDAQGRTGNIVANNQLQFDPNGGQPDALFTGGFSICEPSNYLALNGNTVFYQCQSGNFFNLYDQAIAEQCQPVYITVIPCNDSTMGMGGMASGMSTSTQQIEDGQLQVPGSVNQITDGQLQNGGAVDQIPDGQIQGTDSSVAQIEAQQVQEKAPTPTQAPDVAQFADGRLQPRQVTDEAAVTSYTEAAMFTNAAVPNKAKRGLVGVAAAAAGYAAMI